MSTYKFTNDAIAECKITTAPMSKDNLKFFVGAYEQGVNLAYNVQSTNSAMEVSTINIDSVLTPYSATTVLNNDTYNLLSSFKVNATNAKEKFYTRIVYLLYTTHKLNPTITDTDYQIVTNIENIRQVYVSTATVTSPIVKRIGTTSDAGDIKNTDTTDTNTYHIAPYICHVAGDKFYVYQIPYTNNFKMGWNAGTNYYGGTILTGEYGAVSSYNYIHSFDKTIKLYKYIVVDSGSRAFESFYPDGHTTATIDNYELNNIYNQTLLFKSEGMVSSSRTIYAKLKSPDMLLNQANYGLYFGVDNAHLRKPIITGGIVTGYSDINDFSRQSDIDNWTDFIHTVPLPEDAETKYDRIDDMPLGYTGHVSSFGRYYKITDSNLARLSLDLAEIQDGIGHVISLKSFPVTLSNFATFGSTGTIQIDGLPEGSTIDAQGERVLTLNYDYLIGSIHINGYHGTSSNPHFLDYAPYTKLELYIPFCNFVELPSSCMYQTIDVYLLGDVIDGSCTGVVKCNGQIVAQKTGIIGHSSAISVTDTATRDNAIMQGLVAGIAQTAGLVSSAVAGNVGGFVNGVGGIANTATNTIVGMNANYTRVNGMNAGKVSNALPPTCYLIRYRPDKIDSDNYKKTYGIPCNKTRQLAAGDGFTVIDNFMADCSATQTEKEELKALFRNGVIL